MGAKTWMLVLAESDARVALAAKPPLDREATWKLANALFPKEKLKPIGDGDLSYTCPPGNGLHIGCFPGVSVIAAEEFGIDSPSKLPQRFVVAGGSGVVTLHAMHSVVDWFATSVPAFPGGVSRDERGLLSFVQTRIMASRLLHRGPEAAILPIPCWTSHVSLDFIRSESMPTSRHPVLLLVSAILAGILSHATISHAADAPAVAPRIEDGIAWYDVSAWGVEGKGWTDTARYYDRLPAKAEGVVRGPVWNLSRHSAGMAARFETDANKILVRYRLLSGNVAMSHMPATGVSGVDLYGQNDEGQWRWIGVSRPTGQDVKATLADGLLPGRRAYMVYLPLYNGVESLEIGLPEGAAFQAISPRSKKPIVYYGTSIAHGACASRPGMSFSAILGRWFDRPVINLGFSGNGRMEAEVADLLAELEPCIFVIDCLPNMEASTIAERTEPLVQRLRKSHPETPIVLVEDRTYANTPFLPSRRKRHETSRAAYRAGYERLLAEGVKNLYYVEGESLLGDDGEATTDGSHPSDLGMMRMAEALTPTLKTALEGR